MKSIKTAIIVGAGFSRSMGIPDYSIIMKAIALPLNTDEYSLLPYQTKLDIEITLQISEFLHKVFDWNNNVESLPSLELVFTFLDLSTYTGFSTGHTLGKDYSPARLRTIRRFLIYKLFLIIDKKYNAKPFINSLMPYIKNSDFVSLNWDIALEQRLLEYGQTFCYGIDEIPVEVNQSTGNLKQAVKFQKSIASENPTRIAKIHGSANWAYCDNCNKVFYMEDRKMATVIHTGLYESDFGWDFQYKNLDRQYLIKEIQQKIQENNDKKCCPQCNYPLGSHIATFSFNKSFRTYAFEDSWKLAERILDEADKWVFIGYSLPEADFVFTHLLKCVQKSKTPTKKIIAIMYKDMKGRKKYYNLFGKSNVKVYNKGLEDFVNKHIRLLS
jgi:hypothetical protein